MEDVNKKWISGFWRRIGAAFIDVIILAVVGFCLGLMFGDTFVEMGDWARLVGFVISILYFGVMNSSVANGQTIGKILLKIRVVDADGGVLTLPKSFLRYSVLGIPFFLNGLTGSEELLNSFLIYPLSLIVLGGFFSLTYLYVFNRMTRQSLHDVVVGSYVVNLDTPAQSVSPIWQPHFVIVGILLVASLALPALTTGLIQSQGLNSLLETQTAVNKHPAVKSSGITIGSTTNLSTTGNETTTYVGISASLYKKTQVGDKTLAKELAQTVVDNYPEARSTDVIQVSLTYGYNIGIASSTHSSSFSFAPAELKTAELK